MVVLVVGWVMWLMVGARSDGEREEVSERIRELEGEVERLRMELEGCRAEARGKELAWGEMVKELEVCRGMWVMRVGGGK